MLCGASRTQLRHRGLVTTEAPLNGEGKRSGEQEDDGVEENSERGKENKARERKLIANAFILAQEVNSRSSPRRQCW